MPRLVTLTVEDGTVVANSNSFVTETQIRDYFIARGVTMNQPPSDADLDSIAVLGIKAADYLNILPWKGELVDPQVQTMSWPRKNLGVTPSFPENAVPLQVVQAQLMLALLANSGLVLIPASAGSGYLIKEKIGPIENVYSEKVGVSTNGLPIIPGVSGLLDYWLLGTYEGFVPVMLLSIGDRSYGG